MQCQHDHLGLSSATQPPSRDADIGQLSSLKSAGEEQHSSRVPAAEQHSPCSIPAVPWSPVDSLKSLVLSEKQAALPAPLLSWRSVGRAGQCQQVSKDNESADMCQDDVAARELGTRAHLSSRGSEVSSAPTSHRCRSTVGPCCSEATLSSIYGSAHELCWSALRVVSATSGSGPVPSPQQTSQGLLQLEAAPSAPKEAILPTRSGPPLGLRKQAQDVQLDSKQTENNHWEDAKPSTQDLTLRVVSSLASPFESSPQDVLREDLDVAASIVSEDSYVESKECGMKWIGEAGEVVGSNDLLALEAPSSRSSNEALAANAHLSRNTKNFQRLAEKSPRPPPCPQASLTPKNDGALATRCLSVTSFPALREFDESEDPRVRAHVARHEKEAMDVDASSVQSDCPSSSRGTAQRRSCSAPHRQLHTTTRNGDSYSTETSSPRLTPAQMEQVVAAHVKFHAYRAHIRVQTRQKVSPRSSGSGSRPGSPVFSPPEAFATPSTPRARSDCKNAAEMVARLADKVALSAKWKGATGKSLRRNRANVK